jgi:hypothetical protein
MMAPMRLAIATIVFVFAAACGSKSPKSAEPSKDEPAETTEEPTGVTDENGNPVEVPEGGFVSEECDQYCADGCPEVEDYDGCMADCGCADESETED